MIFDYTPASAVTMKVESFSLLPAWHWKHEVGLWESQQWPG